MTKAFSRYKTASRMLLMLINYFEQDIKKSIREDPYDGFKRDFGLCVASMKKLSAGMMAGMNADEQRYVQHASRGVILTETAANPMHDQYGFWVDKASFRKLITTAWQSNCALCYRQGAEADGCELKKVLDLMSTAPNCEPGKCFFQTLEDDGHDVFR